MSATRSVPVGERGLAVHSSEIIRYRPVRRQVKGDESHGNAAKRGQTGEHVGDQFHEGCHQCYRREEEFLVKGGDGSAVVGEDEQLGTADDDAGHENEGGKSRQKRHLPLIPHCLVAPFDPRVDECLAEAVLLAIVDESEGLHCFPFNGRIINICLLGQLVVQKYESF